MVPTCTETLGPIRRISCGAAVTSLPSLVAERERVEELGSTTRVQRERSRFPGCEGPASDDETAGRAGDLKELHCWLWYVWWCRAPCNLAVAQGCQTQRETCRGSAPAEVCVDQRESKSRWNSQLVAGVQRSSCPLHDTLECSRNFLELTESHLTLCSGWWPGDFSISVSTQDRWLYEMEHGNGVVSMTALRVRRRWSGGHRATQEVTGEVEAQALVPCSSVSFWEV